MLAQRWPYVVYPTPTISQRSNGLPTLAQRSHAIWVHAIYHIRLLSQSNENEGSVSLKYLKRRHAFMEILNIYLFDDKLFCNA